MKNPFIWDKYSDQPHVIKDKKYKKEMRRKYLFDYIKLFFTSLIILPISIILMKLFKGNEHLEYGIGVNLDKGDEQFDLVKELGVKHLIIRFPLWEINRIEEYVKFVKKFKEQDFEIQILLNVMQDRSNIEKEKLLKKNKVLAYARS